MLTDFIGVRDNIQFNRKVTELRYIGDGDKAWAVTTVDTTTGGDEKTTTAQHVVSANGPLSSPRMPEIDGMKAFKGESFHTAQWDKNASLKGKKVAVVGTGASAAQVIVAIADDVEHLTVFQRTPTWCLPRDDEPTPPEIIERFKAGGYSEKLRQVAWREGESTQDTGFTFEALHDVAQNDAICDGLRAAIKEDIKDPELLKLLTPDYPFFCKRALFIDDYYTTYNKSNVTLVHDSGGCGGG